jgi:hypothetical protein
MPTSLRKLFRSSSLLCLCAAANASLWASAQAATTVSFDVAGVESRNTFGSAENPVYLLQLAPFAEVTGIHFDVSLTSFGPSWLSELGVFFTDTDVGFGAGSFPGFGNDFNGTQRFAGFGDLVAQGLNFRVGADGLLRLEFADLSDDPEVNPDGRWNAGNLTFDVSAVPEPASYGLMALGLLALLGARVARHPPV